MTKIELDEETGDYERGDRNEAGGNSTADQTWSDPRQPRTRPFGCGLQREVRSLLGEDPAGVESDRQPKRTGAERGRGEASSGNK